MKNGGCRSFFSERIQQLEELFWVGRGDGGDPRNFHRSLFLDSKQCQNCMLGVFCTVDPLVVF